MVEQAQKVGVLPKVTQPLGRGVKHPVSEAEVGSCPPLQTLRGGSPLREDQARVHRGPYLQRQGAYRCSLTLRTVFGQVRGLWWLGGRWLRGHWLRGHWLGVRWLGLLTLPAFLYFYNQVTALVIP